MATAGLALFGIVMVYSASAVMAQAENGNQFYYVIKQGVWTVNVFTLPDAAPVEKLTAPLVSV